MSDQDTIAAIATAPGRGGVAIVRVSGSRALQVCKQLTGLADPKPRYAYFRPFQDGENTADEGVVLYFKAPHSYTGEDIVEFQGHAGNVAPQRVLSAVLHCPGVRMAEPGEFTKRAFLNGKLDLTAAEAVEDLISAGSDQAARAALSSLDGDFARRLESITEQLTNFRVRLEACLDFPEEHEDFFDSGKATSELSELTSLIEQTLGNARQGLRLTEGAHVVLAGAPNAGKSSLLNAMAGADKAIVTNIPGTTRDVLTVNLEFEGIPLTMTDTAGLRNEPADEIEAIGISRALHELKTADLVLLMVDSSKPDADVLHTLHKIQQQLGESMRILLIRSKTDLPPCQEITELLQQPELAALPQVSLSVKQAGGMDALRQELRQMLGIMPSEGGVCSARRRHVSELEACLKDVHNAADMLHAGDLVLCATEITQAAEHLGTITGKITSDDILGRIFSTFCIGK